MPSSGTPVRVALRDMMKSPAKATFVTRGGIQIFTVGFGSVLDLAGEFDVNLNVAVGGRRNRALLEVAKAERTIVRHFKQRNAALEREMRGVRNHLRPTRVPQERVLTVFQYLAREPRLLERLLEGMTIELLPAPVAV